MTISSEHLNDGLGVRRKPIEDQMRAHIQSSKKSVENDEVDSFFVADMGEVYRLYCRWTSALGRIKPYYAVKCNPDPKVIQLLAGLGLGFECSSRQEIQQILEIGVEPSRILYAQPCKPISHLVYAQREQIRKMTFDGADELYKIKAICPDAELILRICVDDSSSLNRVNNKFGTPRTAVSYLLEIATKLELNLVGISFHIGSAATEPNLFRRAVQDARTVFDQAQQFGYSLKMIDVGGGFSAHHFGSMADILNSALDEYFPSDDFEFIAEPGRYFVETVFTLACNIIARRDVRTAPAATMIQTPSPLSPPPLETPKTPHYSPPVRYLLFLNDGVFGNFMDSLLSSWRRVPHILEIGATDLHSETAIEYSIWGPTCDGADLIVEKVMFNRLLGIGDWLYFTGMGAYSTCFATNFNGLKNQSKVVYVASEGVAGKLLGYDGF